MKNLAYQDIKGGAINVYSAHKDLPRSERVKRAYKDLEHMACIKIYMVKGNKYTLIGIRGYDSVNPFAI